MASSCSARSFSSHHHCSQSYYGTPTEYGNFPHSEAGDGQVDTAPLVDPFFHKTRIHPGKVTKKVYELVQRKQFAKALKILEDLAAVFSADTEDTSVTCLLGFCYYRTKDFIKAADQYEHLWRTSTDDVKSKYGAYYANCLIKCGHAYEALRVVETLPEDDTTSGEAVAKLKGVCLSRLQLWDEAKKSFASKDTEQLGEDFNYGLYLYSKKRSAEAKEVFEACPGDDQAHPEVREFAVAACLYQQGDAVGAIEKAAGIYDDIVKEKPELAPTYEDGGVMVQAEVAGNLEAARAVVAALTLQAACYFQQGQVRTASAQLNIIPNGLDPASQHRVELIKAVLQQQVDPPHCVKLLEELVEFEGSTMEQARLALLIMYLRMEHTNKASILLDEHEPAVRGKVSDEDWRMIEASLVSACDAPSGAKLYTEVMQDSEQEMGYLQNDVVSLKQGLETCEDENTEVSVKRKLAKKEAKLTTVKLSLRMATIGLANLHYKKRNYKEAVKCLQKYIEDCQDDIVYCTALAHCLFMAKNYTESSFIYHTIIEFYKSTSFTLISTPVTILSQYCVAQLFANDEENKASEVMAEMLRSEKVNFEDPESDYHVVAAKRTHVVATCLLIAVTYLENGSYLEAFRKAKEALHLHPWHLTEENNTASNQSVWSTLKKIFVVALHHFAGLITPDSAKLTAALPEVMSDLRELQQFTSNTLTEADSLFNDETYKAAKVTIAEEARKLSSLCELYQNYQAGNSCHDKFSSKLRLTSQQSQELRQLALIKEKVLQ